MKRGDTDKRRILLSLIFPLFFVLILWAVKLIEVTTHSNFTRFGLYPLHAKGIPGIFLSPLIHGDWKHLVNNSVPLLVLGWGIFYFYKEIAWKVSILVYLLSQIWLWFFFTRPAYHIGASGLIYGFGAFLFVSGIIRKNINLLAISLLVAFQYGSMVWGILPIEEHVSWEGHFMGFMSGIILAIYYKDFGPRKPEDNSDEEDETDIMDESMINYYLHEQENSQNNSDSESDNT
ncbi:MAG: rhomboid family intramembrane serine protease [Bacteroidales bacterium]|nr:rhomboid family intramembrane serine protease [Bacteroidales bacterium]